MRTDSEGRHLWRVNSFTDVAFRGNPAGVVPDAEGLSELTMQAIAAELNDVSETVFITADPEGEADIRLRYFTSTMEVDLCGHATIGALFVLHWMGRLTGRDEVRTVRARTAVGVLELELEYSGEQLEWATMEQLAPETHAAPGADRAAEVLGLSPDALHPGMPIGCCSTGIWACFVPLRDAEALSQVDIRPALIQSLWPDNPELTGVYPFAFLSPLETTGRFFSPPKYGIFEDPVTGTACGALGGFLAAHERLGVAQELLAHQGVDMGRAGRVRVRHSDSGRMKISGQATPIFRGQLLAPE